MLIFIEQITCSFLIAMSFVFIAIELKVKFEKNFLIFGISNLLMCSFCAIDIWLQPKGQTLHWTRLQHIIACFFPPFLAWHLMLTARKLNITIVKLFFLVGILFTFPFLTDIMLKPSAREVVSTTVYNVTFAPFMLVSILGLFIFMASNIANVPTSEKRVFIFYLVGALFLSVGGILDLLTIFIGHRVFEPITNYSVPGLLTFCLVATITFTERLALIVRERELTFQKLREAYKELEEVQTLKELGQSTAIINHEIRNFTTAISGFAELIVRQSSDIKTQHMASKIMHAVSKLISFSQDILEFSKSRILRNTAPINLKTLILHCVNDHFPQERKQFIFNEEVEERSCLISGDWVKMEHLFVNLFKNALEADAEHIRVKFKPRDMVLLVTIEDNGIGTTREVQDNMFKSFFTTKKDTGGTGLGMCIVKSTIESHGGHISAYSKTNSNSDSHGLIFHITFPIYEEELDRTPEKKHNILLIKEGIKNISIPIKIFQNTLVNPHVVQKAEDVEFQEDTLDDLVILASPKGLHRFRSKYGNRCTAYALVDGINNNLFAVDERNGIDPIIFSEEFVLDRMLTSNKYASAPAN